MQNEAPQSTCQSDVLDVSRANALWATLGRAEMSEAGQPLAPFFHQLYFWDARPPKELGRDGHPRVGGLIPDMGLPRRMWAGGRLQFHAPLLVGMTAQKTSTCERAERKEGRSGPLALVTLRHDFEQNGKQCITEHQDLVYRQDHDPNAPRAEAPSAPDSCSTTREVTFNSTMLMRYSALTFNGHRIHYDLDYARDVEGYDGLVVHGPLLAQLLMLMAQEELGPLAQFSFRATSPLMHFENALLCRKGSTLWVRGPDGRMCMQATAIPRSK